ncbi:MAG TPA: hypothetical protein VG935_03835 [Patescibacteria group bacterium]|nr:hypothetical protein [Patescibacteria group bacterium]
MIRHITRGVFVVVLAFGLTLGGSAHAAPAKVPDTLANQAFGFVHQWVDWNSSKGFGLAWNDTSEEMRSMIAFCPCQGQVVQDVSVTRSPQGTLLVEVLFRGFVADMHVLERGQFEVAQTDGTDMIGFYMGGFNPLPLGDLANATLVDLTVDQHISMKPSTISAASTAVITISNSTKALQRIQVFGGSSWPIVDHEVAGGQSDKVALVGLTDGKYTIKVLTNGITPLGTKTFTVS